MTFTPFIPASGQTLGNSRMQVLNNFAALRQGISNTNSSKPNHSDVNATIPGEHLFVEMPVQTPGAANLPLANEGGLITQTVASISPGSELFYVRDAVATYFQMTGPTSITTNGYTVIFGGIYLQWGVIEGGTSNANYPFPTPFPHAVFTIYLTSEVLTGAVTYGSVNNSSFRVGSQGSGYRIYFLAIGN